MPDVLDMEYIGQRDYETWGLYMTKESVTGAARGGADVDRQPEPAKARGEVLLCAQ